MISREGCTYCDETLRTLQYLSSASSIIHLPLKFHLLLVYVDYAFTNLISLIPIRASVHGPRATEHLCVFSTYVVRAN